MSRGITGADLYVHNVHGDEIELQDAPSLNAGVNLVWPCGEEYTVPFALIERIELGRQAFKLVGRPILINCSDLIDDVRLSFLRDGEVGACWSGEDFDESVRFHIDDLLGKLRLAHTIADRLMAAS